MGSSHNRGGFRGRRVARGVWGAVILGVVACGAWATHAADDSPAVGLRNLLSPIVPSDLSATIAVLPENWQEWGNGLTADLATLYEQEGLDVAGQRKAIAALEGRLKTVSTSRADSRYRSILTQLVSLEGGLKRRLDVAKAALDTLELGPAVHAAHLESGRKEVARAAAALDGYLRTLKGGDGWVKYLQVGDVRSQLGDEAKSAVTLANVQTRLKGKVSLADARAREFMERAEFTAYGQAVDAYLTALSTPASSADSPELRKTLTDLLNALEAYEISHTTADAAAVRKAFDALHSVAPDGGDRMAQALRSNYFNYNLRVIATEAFLNRIVAQRRQESGPVRDYILGANVSGSQTTVTNVAIDLVPSNSVAQFDLTVAGAVASNTVGVTSQANIYTAGNHHFWAAKRVLFNGEKFWTQPARISVNANNTTLDAETKFSGMFILGGIADRTAMRRAQEMRGESEAIAASRVQDRVLPAFNSEVDKEFAMSGTFNSQIAERLAALHELQLYPDAKSWSSTDSQLRVSSRLMAANEMGGGEPNPALIWGRGVSILLHETLMNNAADRLDLRGKALSDDEVKARIEENLTRLLGRDVKFKDESPADDEVKSQLLVFDQNDPIRVQAANGVLTVTLRVGVRQAGKDDIPTQMVTVPLTISVDAKNVVIEPGNVSIAALERASNPAEQLARAGVIRKKIQAALPRREIDRVTKIERHYTKAVVAVTRIKALDGWLSVTFE